MITEKTKVTKARATAVVTLEVPLSGLWGGDCTVDQVHKQATDEVTTLIVRSVGDALPRNTKILSLEIEQIIHRGARQ